MAYKNNEDDEAQLFFAAVKDVRPIKHGLAEILSDQRGRLPRNPRINPEHKPQDVDLPSDGSSFKKNGVQDSVLRKLRAGHIPIEDELDLHGYSSSEAESQVLAFLLNARMPDRQRGVRIIHGKGLGSSGGKSVLKEKTHHWLRTCDAVLAFCAAGPSGGGTGAVHVLLRKR